MEFKGLQKEVDDMYMILNEQSVRDDFITVLKWEDVQEFLEDIFLVKKLSVYKVQVEDRTEYNEYLISYLRGLSSTSAKLHFPFQEKKHIDLNKYMDKDLTDAIFNVMADGNKLDFETLEIILEGEEFKLTEDIKYLIEVYGFNLNVKKK